MQDLAYRKLPVKGWPLNTEVLPGCTQSLVHVSPQTCSIMGGGLEGWGWAIWGRGLGGQETPWNLGIVERFQGLWAVMATG
jgi:hypothetical protein